MTTGKTRALTRQTFVGKVMFLLFNTLSRLVIAFLPRSKHLLISWLQSPSAVILEPPKIKSVTVSIVSPSICMKWWDQAEAEWLYKDLQDLLELTPKKDVLFIIGDWNAKVGSQEAPGITGKFGLGVWNDAGQWLIEFCKENALVIANTLFQQHKRRLYTWTSPDGQHWNQIDYILCSHRWRSSTQSAKTRPGADCGLDH